MGLDNKNMTCAGITSQEAKQAFLSDGVIVLRRAVTRQWVARIRDALEADIRNPGPYVHSYTPGNGHGRFHGNLRTWESDIELRQFCCESNLPELAATLLQTKQVNLLYDQLFIKEPGTRNPTRWHNDQPYWAVRGWQVMSFWVALDPVTLSSGGLEFIRGSHRWSRWFQPRAFGETEGFDDYDRNPDYETSQISTRHEPTTRLSAGISMPETYMLFTHLPSIALAVT